MSIATLNNAQVKMETGAYWNNGGKRQGENLLEISGKCGYFVDEIFKLHNPDLRRDFSFWLYHGNIIAMYDHSARKYHYCSSGWQSSTTKDRLNDIGANITQRAGKWYRNGELWTEEDQWTEREYIRSTLERCGIHTTGYHLFALVELPDTGNWSDSPYRSEDTEKELQKVERTLTEHGIKSYRGHNTTENIFCMYRTVFVRGCDFARAKEVLDR
jgi:hypothetical protein